MNGDAVSDSFVMSKNNRKQGFKQFRTISARNEPTLGDSEQMAVGNCKKK